MPRQLILDAAVGAAAAGDRGGRRGGACGGADGGGRAGLRSVARAAAAGASVRACGDDADDEHVLLVVLHHIAGDGWSLGPLSRDLAALYRARREGVAAGLAPLPVQYADYTLWQQAALGDEDDGGSALSRQLVVLDGGAAGPAGADRAAGGPAAACGVEPSRRPCGAAASRPNCTVGLRRWRGRPGASLFMVLQAGLAGLLTRLGAGTDIAIGSPIAGRTDAALDDLIGFFVNTLVLRTDTSGNPSFRELIGRVRGGNLAAYGHAGAAVRAAGRGAQSGAVAVAASAVPGDAGVRGGRGRTPRRWSCRGLRSRRSRSRPRARSSTCRSGWSSGALADGAPAGIEGVLEYASDLFDEATRRGAGPASAAAAGGGGCGCRRGRWAACRSWRRPSATPSCGAGTTPRELAAGCRAADAAGAVCRAGCAHAGCGRGGVRGPHAELRRARRPRQPPGASSAKPRRRARDRGGAVRRALAGDGDRAARHPQGRRRLSAARSELPARAAGLHAGRRRLRRCW